MRSQFNKTIKRLFLKNKKIFLILGDIGVYSFRDLLKNKRAINIGILEQASISFASGLSKIGFVPIFHTIATFMVGRAFEQLKLDFGYNKLNGNFVRETGSFEGRDIIKVDPRYFRPTEVETLLGDPTKAKNKLGWEAKITFEKLVEEMVEEDFNSAKKEIFIKSNEKN